VKIVPPPWTRNPVMVMAVMAEMPALVLDVVTLATGDEG
jgi:hypothetical protein